MITDGQIVQNPTHELQAAVRTSRVRALRILGGLQIGLGVVCGILCIVGAILSTTEMDIVCNYYSMYNGFGSPLTGSGSDTSYIRCGQSTPILIMNLTGAALSFWFIMTGCLPLCMTDQRQSSWRCLTIAFLVCNIISAVVFSSTLFCLAVIGALIVAVTTNTGSVIIVSSILAVLSFIEFIISIVSAAHCCCCSQLNTGNQQEVIFMNIAHSGMIHNMPNTQIHAGNQQAYHQIWMPQMQGYHGQQPGNMTNNQRERGHSQGNQMPIQGYYDQQPGNMTNNQQNPGHSQGNQMPIQGYYGQEPQSFEMANQEQNINAQQIGHQTAYAVNKDQQLPITDNSTRSEM